MGEIRIEAKIDAGLSNQIWLERAVVRRKVKRKAEKGAGEKVRACLQSGKMEG